MSDMSITNEKKGFLGKLSRNIHLESLKQEDSYYINGVYNILVNSHQDNTPFQNHIKYYTYRKQGKLFIVGFKRALYKHGEELPFDGGENYVTKINYLAVSSNMDSSLVRKLLARAMLDVNDEHLILVTTLEDDAARVFESLNFTKISGIRNPLKKYVFSFKKNGCLSKQVFKPDCLARDTYMARLPENERRYHTYLQSTFKFDIISLVTDGWTMYQRNHWCFVFILTMGESRIFGQPAFKVDLFDITDGLFVGYNDVYILPETDTAVNDIPVRDFPSVIPVSFIEHFGNTQIPDIRQSDETRQVWRNMDALWVRREYRRAGIGQALERIAGDVCKLVYNNITNMQVCANTDSPQVYFFHRRNGAVETSNKLYSLEYRLNDSNRPLIKILYNM